MKKIIFSIITFLLTAGNAFAQGQKVTTKERCYFLTDQYGLKELYNSPLNSLLIGTIPGNRALDVLEIDTIHYMLIKVQYKKKIGWIHKDKIMDNSFIKNHRIRNEFKELVSLHKVSIGMNPDEVVESWGYPPKKNTTVTANGFSEQWVYSVEANKYVYFENGLVSAVQY